MEKVIQDNIRLDGLNIIAKLFGADGALKSVQVLPHNTVTPIGKRHIMNQLSSAPASPTRYMGIGQSTPTTIALGTEIKRQVVTSYVASGNTCTYIATFTVGATYTVTEAMLCSKAAAGTVQCTNSTLSQLMNAGDSLQITWPLVIS